MSVISFLCIMQELNIVPIDMMDRDKSDQLPIMQLGFIDSICLPVYKVSRNDRINDNWVAPAVFFTSLIFPLTLLLGRQLYALCILNKAVYSV